MQDAHRPTRPTRPTTELAFLLLPLHFHAAFHSLFPTVPHASQVTAAGSGTPLDSIDMDDDEL